MDARRGRAGEQPRLVFVDSSSRSGRDQQSRGFSRARSRISAARDGARDGGAPAAQSARPNPFPSFSPEPSKLTDVFSGFVTRRDVS